MSLLRLYNQKGFTALEGILIGLVIIAIGTAGYFAFEARSNKLAETKPAASEQPAEKPDPYKGWSTFSSKVNKLTFKYPADWKSEVAIVPGTDNTVEEGSLTSPEGFVIEVRNPADGLGGGCGDPCPFVTKTYAAEKISNFPGKQVYVVKQHVYNSQDPAEFSVKRIGFSEKSTQGTYDPTKATYEGAVPVLVAPLNGESMFYMIGSYPETSAQSKLSMDEYFKLDDLKDAELLLKSVKIQ